MRKQISVSKKGLKIDYKKLKCKVNKSDDWQKFKKNLRGKKPVKGKPTFGDVTGF